MSTDQTYNCIVIDDEHLARKLLRDYISKVPQLNLVGSYDSPLAVMDDIQKHNVKIIFTDINMPDILGTDFIEQLSFKPLVIFVTAFSEYAAKAFEIDAIEYLLKPVTFPRFLKAVNKAIAILNLRRKADSFDNNLASIIPEEEEKPSRNFVLVKTERKVVKLLYEDIYFIEGALEYVNFQTLNGKVMGLFSLKKLEEELPPDKFMRIHKSYIVALDKISEIAGNQVKVGDWKITASKALRPRLMERISKDLT